MSNPNSVTTRYRDVPWSEIGPIHVAAGMPDDRVVWEALRGGPVVIQVPALPDTDGCGGPWYRVIEAPVKGALWVCPHLAEIGD